jgi:hypothetical protein
MALQWPRTEVQDYDGFEVANNEVPIKVQHATIELALRSLTDSLVEDLESSATVEAESITVGPISVDTSYSATAPAQKVFPLVRRLLSGLVTSPNTIYPG